MQITIKNIDDLKPSEKNVRIHGNRQIAEYIRSIKMFGQIRPIVIDENNVIMCGNGLFQALKEMEHDTAECYVVSNLTKKQKKKLMLADNKIFELGVNDAKAFDDILLELDGDIDVPGYDEELLKVLTMSAKEAEQSITSYETLDENAVNKNKSPKPQTATLTLKVAEQSPRQNLNEGKEISTDDFSDEKFNCICPRCGFKFNV